MKLYHGTNQSFDSIDLMKSKPNKDFGRGFYLSADYEQALNMAKIKTEQLQEGEPIVMEYKVDEIEMQKLQILRFEEYSEEWAEFILANRSNVTGGSIHQYDIVVGPIANDTVGLQMRRFIQGYIDIERMIEELRFQKPAIQYFFGTEKAISYLKKI